MESSAALGIAPPTPLMCIDLKTCSTYSAKAYSSTGVFIIDHRISVRFTVKSPPEMTYAFTVGTVLSTRFGHTAVASINKAVVDL